jgi:ATP-dependent helicase/nuclease subunit A
MTQKWTEKQNRAIVSRGKSLMVSAAAGSGKTAVMVERIKRLVLSGECSVDRMLVVTFTDAAASEMKQRIEAALTDSIKDPANASKGEYLRRQLDLLPMANISTFHSFSLEVIRKFFFVIGCEPNMKILDDPTKAMLREKAMDEMFEEKYESGDPAFYALLDKFTNDRSDRDLRDMVEALSKRLESLPEPDKWLRGRIDEAEGSYDEFLAGPVIRGMFENAEKIASEAVKLALQEKAYAVKRGLKIAGDLADSDIGRAAALKRALDERDWDSAKAEVDGIAFDAQPKSAFAEASNPGHSKDELEVMKKYIQGLRDSMRDQLKAVKAIFANDLRTLYDDQTQVAQDVRDLAELTADYRARFAALKQERGAMDFDDMQLYCYQILGHDEAADYYRRKFKYVFVDEYQDSNTLQEELISRVISPDRDNLFTVGDVKQSIYKFRLAEPEIFRKRYENYKEEYRLKGEASLQEKIDLNSNFRSKRSVIDFVNMIFSDIMPGYDEDAALYPGDETSCDRLNYTPKLYLAKETWDEDADDALKEYQKTEKEALLAAELIRRYLGKPIYDAKRKCERPLEKRDIVILLRSVKNTGDQFYDVLTRKGIASYVDDSKGFFDTIEITVFTSLLRIIDNFKQDVELMSVMRSEIFGFSVNEMAEIRICFKDGHYSQAFLNYAESGRVTAIKEKCAAALEKLEEWRESARMLPLEEFMWKLMLDTGFYMAMGSMPSGYRRQANLRLLLDRALKYRTGLGRGLYGFLRYMEHMERDELEAGESKVISENEDAVRIMTIHHSKGLEFPMVILSCFGRKLNYRSNTGNKLAVDKDLGIGMSWVDRSRNLFRKTALQQIIEQKARDESVEEEKRMMYVAMTRAEDILLLTALSSDPEKTVTDAGIGNRSDYSFLKMCGDIIFGDPKHYEIVKDDVLIMSHSRNKRQRSRALSVLDSPAVEPDAETERIMGYAYPYEDQQRVRSRYSVSELNERGREEPFRFDASVPRVAEETTMSAARIGTVTHSVLEKLDFLKVGALSPEEGTAEVDRLISEMVEGEYLTPEEGEAVDAGKIYEFAASPLGRRIAAAQENGTLRRERSFVLRTDVDGQEATVQGMIDCFFEEDGRAVLVDYKTTAPRNVPGVKERYSVQMDIYKKAITLATGLEVSEAYLYLTNLGLTVDM